MKHVVTMKQRPYKTKHAVFSLFLLFLSAHSQATQKKVEVSPAVSLYTADTFRSSFAGSLQVDYKINEMIWFGASGFWGKTKLDASSTLIVKNGDSWLGVEGDFYFNMPGILGDKETGNAIDLFTSFGVGYFQIGDEKEPMGMIGGGMIIHFPADWIGIRFDLKNYMYVLENKQGNDFNSDLTLLLGPTFLF